MWTTSLSSSPQTARSATWPVVALALVRDLGVLLFLLLEEDLVDRRLERLLVRVVGVVEASRYVPSTTCDGPAVDSWRYVTPSGFGKSDGSFDPSTSVDLSQTGADVSAAASFAFSSSLLPPQPARARASSPTRAQRENRDAIGRDPRAAPAPAAVFLSTSYRALQAAVQAGSGRLGVVSNPLVTRGEPALGRLSRFRRQRRRYERENPDRATTSSPCATRSVGRSPPRATRSRSRATAARRSIAVERDEPDAAVLDVMMPPPDGLEVCRRLRAAGERDPDPHAHRATRGLRPRRRPRRGRRRLPAEAVRARRAARAPARAPPAHRRRAAEAAVRTPTSSLDPLGHRRGAASAGSI